MTRTNIFETIRALRTDKSFSTSEVVAIDEFLDAIGVPRDVSPFTQRVALELIGHEAIVLEAYKDSVGVWTWSIGLTAYSGIDVLAYKDKPQPLAKCLAAFVDRVRRKYLPEVIAAFAGRNLTEAQIAAALSFHFNTGAIGTADWVASWLAGSTAKARVEFMNWRKPASVISRREKERDLFFDGKWSNDGTTLIIPVSKPSYQPAFSRARRADISVDLREAMA